MKTARTGCNASALYGSIVSSLHKAPANTQADIRQAASSRSFLFFASPPAAVEFLNAWAALLPAYDRIGAVIENDRKNNYLMSNLPPDITRVWTLDSLATADLSGIESLVFYDFRDWQAVENYLKAAAEQLWTVPFTTLIGTSPEVFEAYLRLSRTRCFVPHISQSITPHLHRHMLDAVHIRMYSEYKNNPGMMMNVSPENKEALNWMLHSGLYDHTLISMIPGVEYCSEKLLVLHDILLDSQNLRVILYTQDSKRGALLFKIIRNWTYSLNGDEDASVATIEGRAFHGYKNAVSIQITTTLPSYDVFPVDMHIILFDLIPVLYGCKVTALLTAEEMEGLTTAAVLEECIHNSMLRTDSLETATSTAGVSELHSESTDEGDLVDCGLQRAGLLDSHIEPCTRKEGVYNQYNEVYGDDHSASAAVATNPQKLSSGFRHIAHPAVSPAEAPKNHQFSSLCKFKVMSENALGIEAACKGKSYVLSVNPGHNYTFVHARCMLSILQTLVNLYNTTKEPIIIPHFRLDVKNSLSLVTTKLSLGTVTSISTFCNEHTLHGRGYALLHHGGVSLYSMSPTGNIRIEIYRDEIENYTLLAAQYISMKENRTTERPFCEITIPLKVYPRVYVLDSSFTLGRLLKKSISADAKIEALRNMVWKRATIRDMECFKDRFDVKIYVDSSNLCNDETGNSATTDSLTGCDERSTPRTSGHPFANDGLLAHIIAKISDMGTRMVYTELRDEPVLFELSKIADSFLSHDFSEYFAVLSLISKKGRYLINRWGQREIDYLKGGDVEGLCLAMELRLRSRFETVDLLTVVPSGRKNAVRTAIVTPMGVEYGYEQLSETNRVLRWFDPDKFLRFSIRDCNGQKMTVQMAADQEDVYEYFRRTMLDGLSVGMRKYFFLAATTSQLKEHNAWFITPHEQDGAVVGSDYIKAWLGDFRDIKNIGKYTVRIGQAMSSTTDTVDVPGALLIGDVVRNGYNFTDGIGLISPALALRISKVLGVFPVPSAFQIRYGGCKGIVAVHHLLEREEDYKAWHTRMGTSTKTQNAAAVLSGTEKAIPSLILRDSMHKFMSKHTMLEVITIAKSTDFYLNRQIIAILEGLGVPLKVFKHLSDKAILDMLSPMVADFPSFVMRYIGLFPKNSISTDFRFFRKLVAPVLNKVLESLNKKSKIYVEEGRAAMGVIDELGLLKENEVFLMYNSGGESAGSSTVHGKWSIPSGPAIIVKNPCMHPGDIRVVECVDVPALHYLKEVIVFSQHGTRPLFNQCSGSDLDGDIFLLCWHKALIPKLTYKPYNYVNTCALSKQTVLLSDMVNFYIRYIKTYQLGTIAYALMATADRLSVFHPSVLKLSELFNRNIDFIKTGNIASIPDNLLPDAYPDFMEKQPSYTSENAIGVLYRRSRLTINSGLCECPNCIGNALAKMTQRKRLILIGTGLVTRVESVDENVPDKSKLGVSATHPRSKPGHKALRIFAEYKADIKNLMNKYKLKSEEALFCARDVGVIYDLKAIQSRYTRLLEGMDITEINTLSSNCRESINSLPWFSKYTYQMKVKRGLYRQPHFDTCAFNGNIVLKDSVNYTSTQAATGSLNDYQIVDDTLIIITDVNKFNSLISTLSPAIADTFKEAFNLLLLCEEYTFDQIVDILIDVRQRMKDGGVMEMIRELFRRGDDMLFRVGLMLSLDMSIIYKLSGLRDELREQSSIIKPTRIYKSLNLIISGMLDENEDVEFEKIVLFESRIVYIPVLKNRGVCNIDYYKDGVRDFLISILHYNDKLDMSKERVGDGLERPSANARLLPGLGVFPAASGNDGSPGSKATSPRIFYELVFIPGRLYISQIDPSKIHDRMSVRELQKHIHRDTPTIKTWYVNRHPSLEEGHLPSGLEMETALCEVHLRLHMDGVRYDVLYENGTLTRIIKNRAIAGKEYILNSCELDANGHLIPEDLCRNDLMIELIRLEVIYDGGCNLLTPAEAFLASELLYAISNQKCHLSHMLADCTMFRLEVNEGWRNELGLHYINRTVYAGNTLVLSKPERKQCCYALRGWEASGGFDKAFAKLWRVYTEELCRRKE